MHVYLTQRENATPLTRRVVVAGDESFLKLGAAFDDLRPINDYLTLFSPSVSDQELDWRIACNAVLLGQPEEQFAAEQLEMLRTVWGRESRDPVVAAARLQGRVDVYREIAGHLAAALDHFEVAYLALKPEQEPRSPWQANFALLQDGPTWKIYKRIR